MRAVSCGVRIFYLFFATLQVRTFYSEMVLSGEGIRKY